MLNRGKLLLHYLLPKQWLTRLAYSFASRNLGWLTRQAIKLFIRVYNVDMQEAQQPDITGYATFNDFFTRPLQTHARPIHHGHNILTCPADGVISQLGKIEQDKLLQAKGHDYPLLALLAGNYPMAEQFYNGDFVTIYLSPKDYHRVHMPCDAVLREMIYVPGDLYSVSPFTAQHIPNLFARNERVICRFDSEFGALAQIMVGATIVGSIETAWMGNITPPHAGTIKRWTFGDHSGDFQPAIALRKGQEMGRFKLGSTVITLFAPGRVSLHSALTASDNTSLNTLLNTGTLNNTAVRVGQPLATANTPPQTAQSR